MSDTDFSSVCQMLLPKLDSFRSMWVGVVLELLDDALGPSGGSIANRDFAADRSIPELAEITPADFPFNSVNGETVESALIGFQSLTALQFCLSRGYLSDHDLSAYTGALLGASADDRRWLFSVSAFLGSSGLSAETVAYVLARYFLNEESPTEDVLIAQTVIEERVPFLAYFTQVGTAMAFGDQSTATTMMEQVGA